jgi:hypothetical protein
MDAQTVMILMAISVVGVAAWLSICAWRNEQRMRARRRAWDRLEQADNPERWARRQARQARLAALAAEELAEVRRARWYARLLGWGWR